jgi:uncharacterized membrane protein YjgN (DUF898 family)
MIDPIHATKPKLESLRFAYVPRPGLLKITLINLVFNILTLSLYRFWGKTNVRRHIWSCVHINGEPLEYTGTGIELFRGFLFVFGLIILPFIVIVTALRIGLGEASALAGAANGIFFLFVYTMLGFAIYKARRYQLTRTLWRGIRGNLAGSAMAYTIIYFGAQLAKGASLGWATPAMNTVLQEQIVNDMRFGDAPFRFKGKAGPLYPTFALCWFLFLIAGFVVLMVIAGFASTGIFERDAVHPDQMKDLGAALLIGLALFLGYMVVLPAVWSIYSAKQMRVFADYTRFDAAQFRIRATAASLVWLVFSNVLILILTLGQGWPFVQQRRFRYLVDRLELEGTVDVERIRQSSLPIPTRGEGLADAFDVGVWGW